MARALAAALLAALALAAAGCGGDAAGGGDGGVSLQVFGDAEELAAYRELVAAYEEETGRKASLIEVPDRDAHIQKLTTSFAGGDPPEVFLVNYRNFAPFAARGGLDPVGPRLAGSNAFEEDDFFPQPLEAFEYRGELQCLPQNLSSLVVYYNRDLFRQAGLDDPAPGWTYDDLVEAAHALTDGEVYGVGVEPSVVRLAPFVWSAGGDLVDDPNDPTRFTLSSPEARAGLQAFLDLQGGDRVTPVEEEAEAKPLDERFLEGTLGMFLSSRREVPTFRTIESFDWDVAALPRLDEPATVLHSDAYCLARGATADDAWEFVEFAAGPRGQEILARAGRIVPSLRAVAESPAFLDPSERPRSSRVFLDSIETIHRLPVAATWPEIEDAADLAIKRAFYTEMTVDEALAQIDRETGPLFERARDVAP